MKRLRYRLRLLAQRFAIRAARWWLYKARMLQQGALAECRGDMVAIALWDWGTGSRRAPLWRLVRSAWRSPIPEYTPQRWEPKPYGRSLMESLAEAQRELNRVAADDPEGYMKAVAIVFEEGEYDRR